MRPEVVFSVSDFVASLNQTLEFAYPNVVIVGELANLRISKNRWIYFDLKDDESSVKFFGTVYALPGPLEDGMLLQVRGAPRLHSRFGFSVNVQTIQPVGEGSIKKAAELLEAKLKLEGLFDPGRKRALPYPPTRIGFITSGESAAYADFIKIIDERWSGLEIELADVQVQGDLSPSQIVNAIEFFNAQANLLEVLVITRGGGSADDLAAFSTEQVTRAIAASRIPTLVAIGHEIDISLAEMAADQRASTPSNAAQMLVPDKKEEQARLRQVSVQISQEAKNFITTQRNVLQGATLQMRQMLSNLASQVRQKIVSHQELLFALNPEAVLKRGYSIVRSTSSKKVIKSIISIKSKDNISIQLSDGYISARVEKLD